MESSIDAMNEEDLPIHATRQAIPSTDWDDLTVSYTRGQGWARE